MPMDKYTLPIQARLQVVKTQISECLTLIYRNDLENIAFKKKNDEDKMTEVRVNKDILKRKLDGLYEELGRLESEDSSSAPEPGITVQPEL